MWSPRGPIDPCDPAVGRDSGCSRRKVDEGGKGKASRSGGGERAVECLEFDPRQLEHIRNDERDSSAGTEGIDTSTSPTSV